MKRRFCGKCDNCKEYATQLAGYGAAISEARDEPANLDALIASWVKCRQRLQCENGFLECTVCHVWAAIPEAFDPGKHLVLCPLCKDPMYLHDTGKPADLSLSDADKVHCAILVSQ